MIHEILINNDMVSDVNVRPTLSIIQTWPTIITAERDLL